MHDANLDAQNLRHGAWGRFNSLIIQADILAGDNLGVAARYFLSSRSATSSRTSRACCAVTAQTRPVAHRSARPPRLRWSSPASNAGWRTRGIIREPMLAVSWLPVAE